MSPFGRPFEARYGTLTVAQPYGWPIAADGVSDTAIEPASGSNGYRGAQSSFGAMASRTGLLLRDWRRAVSRLEGVRFLPQSGVSRGVQVAPDQDAAWDWIFVPSDQLREARRLAYDLGLDYDAQANVAETGYWDGAGAWYLVTWGRGGPASWSSANQSKIREGEMRIQAGAASSYGAENVEIRAGSFSYSGDSTTAICLGVLGVIAAWRR